MRAAPGRPRGRGLGGFLRPARRLAARPPLPAQVPLAAASRAARPGSGRALSLAVPAAARGQLLPRTSTLPWAALQDLRPLRSDDRLGHSGPGIFFVPGKAAPARREETLESAGSLGGQGGPLPASA